MIEIEYFRYMGPAQRMEVGDLREAIEHARGDDCYVESIVVDGVIRWRRNPPVFRWTRVE